MLDALTKILGARLDCRGIGGNEPCLVPVFAWMVNRFQTRHDTAALPIRTLVWEACISGSSASLASTLALAFCGSRENGSAAGPINGPSQWLWGESEAHTSTASWRHTACGFAVHHAMSIAWAIVYERAFGRAEHKRTILNVCCQAAAVAGVAYAVDYGLAPRRLRPGFKKHLRSPSIFTVYAAFGLGLAVATITRQQLGTPKIKGTIDE